MGADRIKNTIDEKLYSSADILPDSIKELISKRKFMIYDYGHHGKKWCLIYEDGVSYRYEIGSARNGCSISVSKTDTAINLGAYSNLISWGLDSLPCLTKNMIPQYPRQWTTLYRSLCVYNGESDCIFDSNNAIGFKGCDSDIVNEKFLKLCYLMYWLSAPEIRDLLGTSPVATL